MSPNSSPPATLGSAGRTTGPPTESRTGGVIHDIGYQRYTGPRLGRRHIVGALYVHGLRAAFGLGRSAKAKIFPWLIVGVVGGGGRGADRGPGPDRPGWS